MVVGTVLALVGVLGLIFGWGSSTSTHAVNETPAEFLSELVHAERSGDQAFLFARLHPAVLARYGSSRCRTAVGGLRDPSVALRLVSVKGPAPYAYTSDGHTATVANTYTLHVTGTEASHPVTRDLHFAAVDHRFRIFTDCGQPLPGAP